MRHTDRKNPSGKRDGNKHKATEQHRKSKDVIQADGEIVEALGFENFRVELDNGIKILATVSGKMRQNHIRLLTGDRVQVEMSPYDLTRGRISYRYKR